MFGELYCFSCYKFEKQSTYYENVVLLYNYQNKYKFKLYILYIFAFTENKHNSNHFIKILSYSRNYKMMW